MARYKDLPKIHGATTDGYVYEQSLKGSLSPVQAEPAIIERREEVSYDGILVELQEIKKDIQSLKDFVETMDKNGLKMKRQW